MSFTETADGVEARIRNRDTGEEFPVTARYLIGADGGKTVGPQIGVNMIAPSRIASRVTVHFRADLSSYIDYDTSVMHCIINPHGAMAGRQLSTRSDENTSELKSLMRISYAVFCLKQKKKN